MDNNFWENSRIIELMDWEFFGMLLEKRSLADG